MTEEIKTHAEKTLEAINAVIEKRATHDQQSYTVNGLSITRMNIEELLKFQKVYEIKVAREKNPKRKTKIKVRFVS